MGEDADAVLTFTNVMDEEQKKYKSVIKKFDDFFKVRREVIPSRTWAMVFWLVLFLVSFDSVQSMQSLLYPE